MWCLWRWFRCNFVSKQPIKAYYSEAFKGKSTLLSTYDKEMLAVVKAVRKWRPYLLDRSFVIKTDRRSLKYLSEQRLTTPSQARWLQKIIWFDYTIQYRKGKENQGADALSRVVAFQFHALSLPIADWWKILHQEVLEQPYYNTLLTNQSLNCVQRDGIWMQSGRVHLSPTSSLLPAVLIQWKGALPEDASMENLWRFTKTYPQFNLVDKEFIGGMDW